MQNFHIHSHSHLPEKVETEVNCSDDHDDHNNESILDEDYKEHVLTNDEKDPKHYSPVIWMIVIGEESF